MLKARLSIAVKKRGVPLSDVWEIPFLNPKAKERCGYPTQKPVLLLERIIEIASDVGDIVLDPFCGSGTTLVAAKLMERQAIGMDSSKDAVDLALSRIESPYKTESNLLQKGRAAYANADNEALALLKGLDIVPVQRNSGIDALLNSTNQKSPITIKVQRQNESLADAANKLAKASQSKNASIAILIRTHAELDTLFADEIPSFITVIDTVALQVEQSLSAQITQFIDLKIKHSSTITAPLPPN